jgi:hypothetical protein
VLLFIDCQQITIIRECFLGFPRSLGDRVTFPFDKILIRSSSSSMFQDCFHIINFFSIKNVRNWSGEVFTMYFSFDIGFEKHSMEDIMSLSCGWQFQSVSNRSQDFFDFEWSFSFRCHLFVIVRLYVLSVQPNLLSDSKWSEGVSSSFCNPCSS